jgi:hypothetical protein
MSRVGPCPENPAYLDPAQYRQIEVQDDQVGRTVGDDLQRRVSAANDFRFGLSAAFERVFDQPCDVLLVFDDEHAMPVHAFTRPTVSGARFGVVTGLLNVGYEERPDSLHGRKLEGLHPKIVRTRSMEEITNTTL